MGRIIKSAIVSAWHFMSLSGNQALQLRYSRLGATYKVENRGTYTIFRETISLKTYKDRPVVLVVGFRLKVLRGNRLLHWLFQRICILTTPFWSGFDGFSIKLWMVDPKTKNYLGIYKWAGKKWAEEYVHTLVRVLRPLSVKNSVWYELHDQSFEAYLNNHNKGKA